MYKYLIRFSKTGYIRFTSHLDMIRLFQRGMKRAGIALAHSQGFHPHPRMSVVQPLSLGFTSEGEYVEIETQDPYRSGELQKRLCCAMPEGIGILMVKALMGGAKSPASLIEYGAYEIHFAAEQGLPDLQKKTREFLAQEEILTEKFQKKTGKMIPIDIRPFIYEHSMEVKGAMGRHRRGIADKVYYNYFTLTIMLRTGSTANLNPELLLKEYFAFTGIEAVEGRLLIHRKDLFFMRRGELVSLSAIV